ncbi:hypothetical protein P389DRAFT_170956 [Cystobasidium minutum MCA 4210]|uniref:uncharacterized protein n=1 Tax=Cystobasidium minutum MCA 4210 TaxID=1397322 RepID=UPI0034CDD179|eukprot:jgi/Rhomi1/170956/fgenesh1_kg.4_\
MLHAPTQLEALIEVSSDNGTTWTPAPEYKPDIQDKTCSAYIESVTGNRFRILVRNHPVEFLRKEFSVYFDVDGHQAANRLFRLTAKKTSIDGFDLNSTSFQAFAFSKIATTNDDNMVTNNSNAASLGEITLKFWWVKIGERRPPTEFHQVPAARVFAEQQVKKKSSHSVEAGPVQNMPAVTTRSSIRLEDEPFLSFRFRYMSDVLLDINDIKPLEIPAEVAPDAPQADNNQPEASTSTAAARPIVKAEKTATQTGKRSSSSRVIEIDDDEDEESEVQRLRKENARLRMKVKTETKNSKQVIDLSED